MVFIVSVVGGGLIYPQLTWADCRGQESEIVSELNELAAQMGSSNDGICNLVRRALPVYRKGVNFYANCPAADPTGQNYKALLQTVQSMEQTAQQACS
jgi:hypothetical protein